MGKFKILHGPLSQDLLWASATNRIIYPLGSSNSHRDFYTPTHPHRKSRIGINHSGPNLVADVGNYLTFNATKQNVHSMIRPFTGDKEHRTFLGRHYKIFMRTRIHHGTLEELNRNKGDMLCWMQMWGPDYSGHARKNPPIALMVWRKNYVIQHLCSNKPPTEQFTDLSVRLEEIEVDDRWHEWKIQYIPGPDPSTTIPESTPYLSVTYDDALVYQSYEPNTIATLDNMGPIPMFGSYSRALTSGRVDFHEFIFEESTP